MIAIYHISRRLRYIVDSRISALASTVRGPEFLHCYHGSRDPQATPEIVFCCLDISHSD